MSVTIKIATVDRTDKVEYSSFSLDRALTSQIDTLRFTVVKHPDSTYKPTILDAVEVQEGATKIFGGQIVEVNEKVEGKDVEMIECVAKDYSYDMDRSMVIQSYTNQTVNAIISDINTNFLPAGYDITNVNCPIIVGYIAFNYEQPSKCFQQLAELTGYAWYVDEAKKIHFFAKDARLAPFNLDDSGEKYYYNSLVLKRDLKNLRNTIIVRGGTYQGDTTSEKEIADGTALVYKQGNQYSNVTVKVATVSKTVGIDNIDDPASYDCLYNFQEKFVRFKTATKPSNGQEVEVGGNPHIPVIVKVKDNASVALYGSYEYKVIDKSIATKQGARDRAKAEITAWAQTVNDGSFETVQAGLEVGQKITVNSTIRGITNEVYVISRINSRLAPNGTQLLHKVTLMTNQTYGMIEFLQKLLINKDKEIEIKEGEVLDEVEAVNEDISVSDGDAVVASLIHNPQSETIAVGETVVVQSLNYAVEFNAGEQAPSGFKRQFILDGSLLG